MTEHPCPNVFFHNEADEPALGSLCPDCEGTGFLGSAPALIHATRDNRLTRRAGDGFVITCSCGWRGAYRTLGAARSAGTAHRTRAARR